MVDDDDDNNDDDDDTHPGSNYSPRRNGIPSRTKSVLISARASSKADAMTKTCKVHLPFVLKGRLSLVGKATVNPTFKQNDSSANKNEGQRLNQNSKGFHMIY